MKNCFSVIVLTETNIDICHKNLYHLPNYTSEYIEKFSGKRKSTGIELYIYNEFIFNRMNKFSRCTKNMESLFVTITNTNVPITVGVVYRPPSGLIKNFLNEWESILKQLPEKNVIIMSHAPDIVILNETWLKESINDNEILPSNLYTIFRCDRSLESHPIDKDNPKKFRRNGGGVLIAINNTNSLAASFKNYSIKMQGENVSC